MIWKFPIWFFLIVTYGYWIHRAYHHYPFLWRFHAVHHRAFSFRFHPVESLLNWGVPFIASVPFMGWTFCSIALGVVLFESYRGHGGLESVKGNKKIYKAFGFVTRGYHKQHHLNPSVNFDQVTTWWDHWAGTVAEQQKA